MGAGGITGQESRLVLLEGAVSVVRALVLLRLLRRSRAQVGIGTVRFAPAILGGKIDLQHVFLPTEDHIFSH